MKGAAADRALLSSKIQAAKSEVTDAEGQLERVISELRVTARAEKTTISAALESAFTKLRAARKDLEVLGELLADDGEDDETAGKK